MTMMIVFSFAGCQLPSDKDYENFVAQQTEAVLQETAQFEALIQTAQANVPVEATAMPTSAADTQDETEIIQRPEAESTPTESSANPPDTGGTSPTTDPNRTAPELPAVFTSDLLNKLDTPHTYEKDACTMIKNRWGEGKAEPGTIVMPIMYHGILTGTADQLTYDNQITAEMQVQLSDSLAGQGFQAIDGDQFANFMLNNDYIPPRSFIYIVDDLHHGGYFETHFKPYYEQYGWKVINAFICSATDASVISENEALAAAGIVDYQSHGVIHNENMTDSSTDEFLDSELGGSKEFITEHFGKAPVVIIWPGGNYGYRPIEKAKEYGYKVGFSVNPRGPVMYNWVPLADEADPGRPSFMVDGIFDPLFVIPRYWDTDAINHIDTVRQIGKAAKEYLEGNRDVELEYYDIVCKPEMGDL